MMINFTQGQKIREGHLAWNMLSQKGLEKGKRQNSPPSETAANEEQIKPVSAM
jgi:hypothetical protein